MKKNLILLFFFSSLLLGFDFSHLFKKPNSHLKVVCDEDKEKIYLDNKFKTTCNEGDEISLTMYEGEHTLVVKTEPSKDYSYYYFETKFKIGDGVEKTIKVDAKKFYTKQFFVKNAKKSIAYKFLYLEQYPNDSLSQKIKKELQDTWQKTFAKNIIPVKIISANNGFIILGTFINKDKDGKKYLVVYKINKNGNLLWQKNFKTKNDTFAKAIYKTKNDNYLIIGETKDYNNIYSIYLLKINKNGNKVWEKIINTNYKKSKYDDYGSLIYSMKTKDGNILIIFNNENYKTKINKINSTNGKILWSYNARFNNPYDIKEIKDKDYLMINEDNILEVNYNKPIHKKIYGKTYTIYKVWEKPIKVESKYGDKLITYFIINNNEFVRLNQSDNQFISLAEITKFDKNSKILWKKTIEVPENMEIGIFYKPEITSYAKTKDAILFSASTSLFKSYEPYLFKIDNNGNIVWESMLCINHACRINSILPLRNGVIISGTKDNKLWVMKVDKNLLDKFVEK